MKLSEINITLKNILLFTFFIVTISVVYYSINILLILLLSLFIAYILNPLVELMIKIRIPRVLAVVILVMIMLGFLIIFLALILPFIITDLIAFVKALPSYINILFGKIEELLTFLEIELSFDHIKTFIIAKIDSISSYALTTLTTTLSSLKGAVSGIVNIFIIPVMVFFLLKDLPQLKVYGLNILESLDMRKVAELASEFEKLIGKYFKGMVTVGLILSVLYSSVLKVVGVDHGILLGVITGMGVIIPYVGFGIGLVVSLFITIIQFQDFMHPLYVLIGFTIVQMLESFVITPKIVGDSLGLSPIIVIVALLIGGSLFAIPGMLLALPMAAFIKILIDRYILKKS